MPVELKVPQMGESITEVEVGRWLKQKGERVGKDEPIVEIESDKATQEMYAPVAGVVSEILKPQGQAAEVGETIGYLEEGEEQATEAGTGAEEGGMEASTTNHAVAEREEKAGAAEPETQAADRKGPEATPEDRGEGAGEAPGRATEQIMERPAEAAEEVEGPRVMPAARRLLEEHGISAEDVEATGPGGRLLKEDVQRHIDRQRQAAPAEAAPAPQPAAEAAAPEAERQEEVVPMSPLRRRIAERLVQAQQDAALLTTFNEVDMSAVMALRSKYKESFQQQYDIKLGFMSFFVKAAIEALKRYPAVNAEVREQSIVYRNYYDVGIAVGTGKGLVVPVLRNAERMSFAEVELAIADFTRRVQENKIKIEELQGGTFTITNGGVFGSMLSTPIINPPQSGILGMHAIQQRPVAIEGKVEIRPMMYLALTYDHRIVDGREAVSFLRTIKESLEDPARMLLEV
ncbi:MAG: 2-oxoglutarate dehydrogenase complex dihydrolipoyllysine-residue succinyltransferase [Phycisphaeraceae bacterium]